MSNTSEFKIKISSNQSIKFKQCNWNDFGYHYRWNLSINNKRLENNKRLGEYVLIPFDNNGKLVADNDLDLSNKDLSNKSEYKFIGRALDENFYLSLFDELEEEDAKAFLEYINDINFSCNVLINDEKVEELKGTTNQESIISINDIVLSDSSKNELLPSQDETLYNHDVIEGCLFRNKNAQQIKIKNLSNQTNLENYDIKVILLFVYKSCLLKKYKAGLNIFSIMKTLFLKGKLDLNLINSNDNLMDFILKDKVFQKINYEVILFNLIKNKNKNKNKNNYKYLFNRFIQYCFNRDFKEGKTFLYKNGILEEKDQKKIKDVRKLSENIRNDLSIKKEKPLLCSYTDIQAAKSICKSGVFYLSEIHQMNDPLENRVFESFISQKLTDSLKYYSISTYVMSLTDRIDYLPMWNMYGNDCKGVCCVFNDKFLHKLKDKIFKVCYIKRVPNNTVDIFKEFINAFLIYNDEDELKKASEIIQNGSSDYQNMEDKVRIHKFMDDIINRIKDTIVVEAISGDDNQDYSKKIDYNNIRRLMISYIIGDYEETIISDIFEALCRVEKLLKVYRDGEKSEDRVVSVSQKLNSIMKTLNEDKFSDEGKKIAMAEVVKLLGPVLKFEDYSYEHEYRIMEEDISLFQVKKDTKEFEEEICGYKDTVRYKINFCNENSIFSSLIFGPKLQYDMIYPQFKIEWNRSNILLQKSEIHYR